MQATLKALCWRVVGFIEASQASYGFGILLIGFDIWLRGFGVSLIGFPNAQI